MRLDGLAVSHHAGAAGRGAATLDARRRGRPLAAAGDDSRRPRLGVSGYTSPVLSGTVRGALRIGGEPVAFDDAAGYHDHNWGFWEGVRWQWGQVAHDDVSIVYGRVFPPADVADPERVPGFLGVLGPEGPLGFSTTVSIRGRGRPGAAGPRPRPRAWAGDRREAGVRGGAIGAHRDGDDATRRGPALDFLQLAGDTR